ncbi:MAG: flagellar hook-associated protein FlgL [Deltaproteobacteria bacterium]|nr:flagellar hook-associated protein FlgL [Deltaproteobacteria bacterium]
MRVTNKLMSDTVSSNLFKNAERLLAIQNMVASGKRINRPSDDPLEMGRVLDYRKRISTIDQYTKNISHGESWLTVTDSTLGEINDLLIRVKTLAVYQATETATEDTRKNTAEEVKQIYDQILQLGNTTVDNRHIFAGYLTDINPLSRDDDYNVTYSGDSGKIDIMVGENTTITINTAGTEVFSSDVDIFGTLQNLINGLESNDTDAISGQIELLDEGLNQVLGVRAQVGTKLNRLETTENYWENFKLNVTQMLSETEDADISQAITDLTTQEAMYQASLASAARMIQPSLIDFLT